MKTPSLVAVVAVTAITMAWGCSVVDERLGIQIEQPPSQFVSEDAGPDASPDPRALITYCPSNKCPPGWTTCPNSRFPCDVNVLADPSNCGACGAACPESTGFESFACVEGRCVMQCTATFNRLDCDGVVDNGCETSEANETHCGACGNTCALGTHCLPQDGPNSAVACGCPSGKIDCGVCTDVTSSDSDCGACNNACDRTGGVGAPQYPNMYYGCAESTCGTPKCTGYFLNCDSELENGCETEIVSDENCGACGNTCSAGKHCLLNEENIPTCVCDGDLTPCDGGTQDGYPKAFCVDVSSDPGNCGACGVSCAAMGSPPGSRRTCDFGACLTRCIENFADCNGNEADGCEIDTRSDPRNCGGCGIVCDAVAGQACVAGKCVVEPCDQGDAGEVTR